MAGESTSPNMNLVLPGVGVTSGPQYATDLNNSLTIIDSHDHSTGSGVQITPSGLNISSDLSFLNNNAISLRSVRFSAQGGPISGVSDLGCLYEAGADLYYNDGLGNQIRITQSGGLAGTPGSIANLLPPASATYVGVSQTFVWQSAANTPANLDAASIVLRNLVANSKGLTLSPPNAMGADYSLVLPALPVSTLPLVLDSSGNISTAQLNSTQLAANSVGNSQLQASSVDRSKIASGVALISQQTIYSTAGVFTFTVPANVTYVIVEGCGGGGGGGGGGGSSTSTGGGGGGGGSAGVISTHIYPVTPGANIGIQVGAGGAGGAGGTGSLTTASAGADGSPGDITLFDGAVNGLVFTGGNPGKGGTGANGSTPGVGGAGGQLVSVPGAGGIANTSGSSSAAGSGGGGGGGADTTHSPGAGGGSNYGGTAGIAGVTQTSFCGGGGGGGAGARAQGSVSVGGQGGGGGNGITHAAPTTGGGMTLGGGGGGGGGAAANNIGGGPFSNQNGATGANGAPGYLKISWVP